MSQLEPGQKLDILIAKKIFGFLVKKREVMVYGLAGDYVINKHQMRTEIFDDGSGEAWEDIPPYSSDMTSALKILEKLQKDNHILSLICTARSDVYVGPWYVVMDLKNIRQLAESESAPYAICLAALQLSQQ